jgi:hypothetical protein
MKWAVLLLLLTSAVGCAPKKVAPKLPSLEIPPACAKKIVVEQCDTSVNPPKCHGPSIIDYEPASCAIVHLP